MASETDRQDIVAWLIAWTARELGLPAQSIEAGRSLLEYGMGSLTATILVGDLEDWLQIRLPPSLAWDYPSIDAIADYLVAAAAGDPERETAPASSDKTVPGAADGLDARHLLDNLDQLSDAEVDALLARLTSSEQGTTAG